MNALHLSDSVIAAFWAMALDAALKSTLLLVAAAATLRTMRRCSAAARHVVLVAVVASLAALPLISLTLPRLDVLPSWPSLQANKIHARETTPTPRVPTASPASVEGADAPAPAILRAAPDPAASAALPPLPRTRLHLATDFLWRCGPVVWAIGLISVLLPTAAALVSLSRLERKSTVETSASLVARLSHVGDELGTRRPVRLLTTDRRAMPMTWGLLRPKILLPAEAITWPESRQRLVLLHELAHIQRGDFATTLLLRFVCAIHWFNPLVWLIARRLRLEQEQACDDSVLRAGTRATGYAEEVLHLAAGSGPTRLEALGALTMARRSSLEERLRAILDRTRDRAAPSRFTIVTTLAVIAVGLVPLAMLRAGQASPSAVRPARAGTNSIDVKTASHRPQGLVAWWRADGDGKDSAGIHHGEFPFGISFHTGWSGEAFDFRRSYAIKDQLSRVTIPDHPDFQLSETLTLETRVYVRSYGGIILLRGDDRPGFDTWQLDVINGKLSFNFDSAENKSAELLAPIPLNKWQHVVAVFDRGAMKLYVNGTLAAESRTELRPNPTLDSRHSPALSIGNTGGTHYSIPFDGFIDEVKIYNRPLSEAEVAERLKS